MDKYAWVKPDNFYGLGNIDFEWAEWPLGVPLEEQPDGSLGGERSGPMCGLAIIYDDGGVRLRNGIRITCSRSDLTDELEGMMYNALTDWLGEQL